MLQPAFTPGPRVPEDESRHPPSAVPPTVLVTRDRNLRYTWPPGLGLIPAGGAADASGEAARRARRSPTRVPRPHRTG